MKISDLILQLKSIQRKYGDVEVTRIDGRPFTVAAIDEQTPSGRWTELARESLEMNRKER